MDENRIGSMDSSGVTTWPEMDILGNSYHRPPGQTVGIGDNRFVVVPIGMNKAKLVELLAEFAPPVKVATGKSKRFDEAEATT